MKKVALIGASGFVGSALLKELTARGHEVTAIVRNPEKVKATGDKVKVVKVVKADATDPDTLAKVAKGMDAIISAYNPGWGNPRQYEENLENYPKIVEGAKRSGVERLLIVGGAGSLFVKPGLRLVDTGTLPAEWVPAVKSCSEFFLDTLSKEDGIDWAYFCPAGMLEPGERTGKFRLGKDDLIVDAEGKSRISVEDYALAMVDELEKPAHHKERFTIGY